MVIDKKLLNKLSKKELVNKYFDSLKEIEHKNRLIASVESRETQSRNRQRNMDRERRRRIGTRNAQNSGCLVVILIPVLIFGLLASTIIYLVI